MRAKQSSEEIFQYEFMLTWMQPKPIKMVSTLKFEEKKQGLFVSISIKGHHMCFIQGYVDKKEKYLELRTDSPKNKKMEYNGEQDNPCVLKN